MIDWNDYEPLKQLALRIDIPYTTMRNWAVEGRLPGVVKRFGTRWFVPKTTVAKIEKGEIDVSDGKGDRTTG
jgi:predicted site-specific integrase-resolvase